MVKTPATGARGSDSGGKVKRVGIGIAILGATLALGTTSAAQAAGTVHNDYPKHCDTFGDYTVCQSSSDQYKHTFTPSGNESFVGKATAAVSVSGPDGLSYSETVNYKFHILLRVGGLQVDHEKWSDTFTYNGTTCTIAWYYQFSKGALRHGKTTISCS